MGLFDRFRKNVEATPVNQEMVRPAVEQVAQVSPAISGGVIPRLVAARVLLESKDLVGALAIYEAILNEAGDRTDVLVTISSDLGVNGYMKEIIEIVAPRYDAQKHGPAAGLNLLQAYLALREAESAQHVLDVLFALNRSDMHDRLLGFSNAIADLIQAENDDGDPKEQSDDSPTRSQGRIIFQRP